MHVIGWRAWYTEGRVFDSASLAWADLPDDGMLLLMIYFDERDPARLPLRRQMTGRTYYFKFGEEVYGDTDDSVKEIQRRYPGAVIKQGMWVSDHEMQRVVKESIMARFAPGTET